MARSKSTRSKAKSKVRPKGKANVQSWAPARSRRRRTRRDEFFAACDELWAYCTRLPVIFAFGITMGVCIGITVAEIDELRHAPGAAPGDQLIATSAPPVEATNAAAPAAVPEPEDFETAAGTSETQSAQQGVPAPEPEAEPMPDEAMPPPVYTEETEPQAAPQIEIPAPAPSTVAQEPATAPQPVPYESHEPDPVPQTQTAALPAPAAEAAPLPVKPTPTQPEAPKSPPTKPVEDAAKPKEAPQVASVAPEPAPAAPLIEPAPTNLDIETSAPGPLYPPAPADAPAWLKNAVASVDPGSRPMIAIVLDDVGVAPQDAESALTLPGPVTMSIMTYAPNAAALAKRARMKGHEIMVHMPMEPVDHSANPGPNALLVGLTEAEIRRRVVWGLSRFGGYVGINNHMGSRFTQYAPGMRIVMEELKARGLLFLDSRTIAATVGDATAAAAGVTHVSRDVFLDNTMSVEAVLQQLQDAEAVARSQGYVVAIGHPHPTTVAALKRWIPEARKAGFVLVPLSAIVKKREGLAG